MPETIKTEKYEGPERRRYAKTLEQLETDIQGMFSAYEEKQREWIKELRNDLLSAFPDGDIDGHCTYHQNKILAAKAEEEFWKAAKDEAIKNGVAGVFAVLKILATLAILGIAYKMGIGPIVAKLLT